jgi:ABC-type phosphate transport system auxiliary subunit
VVREASSGGIMSTPEEIQRRIDFIQKQLNGLEHYLPETYDLLMQEMDPQQYDLMKHKLNSFYQSDHND